VEAYSTAPVLSRFENQIAWYQTIFEDVALTIDISDESIERLDTLN
jgi:hypothetical protein